MKKLVYSLTKNVPYQWGGRTRSILMRIHSLNATDQFEAYIVSFQYKRFLKRVNEDFIQKGYIDCAEQHINLFANIQGETTHFDNYMEVLKQYPLKKFHKKVVRKEGKVTSIQYTEKKEPKLALMYKNTILDSIRFYEDGWIKYKGFIDEYGNISVVFEYEKDATEPSRLYYLDDQLRPYVIYRQTITKTGKIKIQEIFWFTEGKRQRFTLERDFIAALFDKYLSKDACWICDDRKLDDSTYLFDVDRYYVMHSSHRKDQSDVLTVKAQYKRLFLRVEAYGGEIISLTRQQKEDILKLYPLLENHIHVISHYADEKPKASTEDEVKPYFLIAARICPQKQIEDSIQAFALAQEELPGYTLEIYGEGTEEEQLKQWVKEGGIKRVHFHPFTNKVDELMNHAAAYLCTSKYEGFSLSLNEALNNGCPVVSYDIPYGPNDMVEEGENGLLVPNHDIKTFAKKMVEIVHLENEHQLWTRDKIQRVEQEKYGLPAYVQKWKDLLLK